MAVGSIQNKHISFFGLKCVSIFLISLQSYYFYGIGVSLFPLVGLSSLIVIFLIEKKTTIDKNILNLIFIILSLLVLAIVGDLYFLLRGMNIYKTLYSQIGFIVFLLALIIFSVMFNSNEIKKIIFVVMVIHLLFFYGQFLSAYLFHYYPDFLQPVTGEKQRYLERGLIRCTGLFNEPATYSNFMALFILVLFDFLLGKKHHGVFFAALLSIFLSFSFLGFIFGSVLFSHYILRFFKNKIYFKLFLFLLIVVTVSLVFIYRKDLYEVSFIRSRFESSSNMDGRLALFFDFNKFSYSTYSLLFGPIISDGSVSTATELTVVILNFGVLGFLVLASVLLFYFRVPRIKTFVFFLFAGIPALPYPLIGVLLVAILMQSRLKRL